MSESLFVSFFISSYDLQLELSLRLFCLVTRRLSPCVSVFLCSLGRPRHSLLSLPFTLVHLLAFFIYIFFNSSTQQLCSSLPLSPSVSPSDYRCLYLSPVSSSETSGAKLSVSLSVDFFFYSFLNLSQLSSSVGASDPFRKASKREKSQLDFLSGGFKRLQFLVLSYFPE